MKIINICDITFAKTIFLNDLKILVMSTLRNQVQLLGFVGNDPEIRATTQGKKVANFRLATSESYKDQQGAWQTETSWHTLTAWDGLAERIEQQVKKGSYLLIEGKLVYRTYTDSNNVSRTVAEIRVNAFVNLDRNKQNTDASNTMDHANNMEEEAREPDLPF